MNAAAEQPQVAVAEDAPKAIPRMAAVEMMDSILDATVRRQYEQAVTDRYMAQSYSKGAGVSDEEGRTLIALGRDYGWGPAHSLTRLYVRDGKPHLYAEARASMLAQAGYKWIPVKHNAEECTYQFKYKGEWMEDVDGKPLRVSFTLKQAQTAGYVENARGSKPKGNYDKIPENMLFARMISNFHRWHAAEVDGATLADSTDIMERVVTATEERIANKTTDAVDALAERLQAEKIEEKVMVNATA